MATDATDTVSGRLYDPRMNDSFPPVSVVTAAGPAFTLGTLIHLQETPVRTIFWLNANDELESTEWSMVRIRDGERMPESVVDFVTRMRVEELLPTRADVIIGLRRYLSSDAVALLDSGGTRTPVGDAMIAEALADIWDDDGPTNGQEPDPV